MTDQMTGYSLVVSFPDQSASFVHGFEAGRIDAQMTRGDKAEIEVTTHSENREVLRRMAVAYGWEIEVEKTEIAGWDTTKMRKVQTAPERPNPRGLTVVSGESNDA